MGFCVVRMDMWKRRRLGRQNTTRNFPQAVGTVGTNNVFDIGIAFFSVRFSIQTPG